MEENRKGQNLNRERSQQEPSTDHVSTNTGRQRTSSETESSSLDHKSAGMGRRNKGRGLSSKDGLTGSDFDGQVTD